MADYLLIINYHYSGMRRKTISYWSLVAVSVGLIGIFGLYDELNVYGYESQDHLDKVKNHTEKCKEKYESYKVIGESRFRIQNIVMTSLNDCIKTYKSPDWHSNFHNTEEIAMKILGLQSHNTQTDYKEFNKGIESKIEKMYTIGIGKEKYFVKFNICAGSDMEQFPEIHIKSDKEDKTVEFQKLIMPETCRVHEYKINAKYSESIVLSFAERQE